MMEGDTCGSNSVGRVTAFQAVGRGFEPRLPLKREERLQSKVGRPGWNSSFAELPVWKGKWNLTKVKRCMLSACVAQLVEHFLGKEEVIGSIPIASSWKWEEYEGIDMRDIITLECTDCKRRNYSTTKNKKKQTGRVEYKKYCPWCKKRTPHKETK